MPSFKTSRWSFVSTLFLIISAIFWWVVPLGIFDIFCIHVAYTRTFTISQFLGCYTSLFFCEKLFYAARRIFFG